MAVHGYGNMAIARGYWTREDLAIDNIRWMIRRDDPMDLAKLDDLLDVVNGEFYAYHMEDN